MDMPIKNYSDDDRGKGAGLWADEVNFSVNDCNFTNSAYRWVRCIPYDSNATFENVYLHKTRLYRREAEELLILDSNNYQFNF